jgi:hypothetical protein
MAIDFRLTDLKPLLIPGLEKVRVFEVVQQRYSNGHMEHAGTYGMVRAGFERGRRFGGGPRSLRTFCAGFGSGTAGTARLRVTFVLDRPQRNSLLSTALCSLQSVCVHMSFLRDILCIRICSFSCYSV